MPEILIDIKELYEGEQAKIKNILVYISKVLGDRSIIICHPEHLQWVRGISLSVSLGKRGDSSLRSE